MATVTYSYSRFICRSTYDERMVPKNAGFRWDPASKQWFTTDVGAARRLQDLWDDSVRAAVGELEARAVASIEASRAATSEIALRTPEGLDHYPFQKAGIAYALEHRHVLIADDMGLGKSCQALGVINNLPERERGRVLIVCPASLRLMWERESRRWLIGSPSIAVVKSAKDGWPTADVVIVSYDGLSRLPTTMDMWSAVVFDEAHYLKEGRSKRTKAALRLSALRRLFLTGTPILNKPVELWPILQACRLPWARSWEDYVVRYCAGRRGRFGWEVDGASNLEDLELKLRQSLMVRRLKSQVLAELPAKTRQVIALDADTPSIRRALEAEHKAKERLDEIDAALAAERDTERRKALAADRLAAGSTLSGARVAVALLKMPAVVEQAKAAIEAGQAPIVFAHHHAVLDALAEALPDAARADGRHGTEARQAAVDDFQAGRVPAIICGLTAMGVGHTLTRSSAAGALVIFAELDWVPANLVQAEDRAHRIGQRNAVLCQYPVFAGSIDDEIARKLDSKSTIASTALDGQARRLFERDPVPADAAQLAFPTVDRAAA